MATGLNVLKFNSVLNWSQAKAITGFASATDSGQLPITISPTVDATHANRIYFVQGTLAASATLTIDFFSIVDPVWGDTIAPVRAYMISFLGAGAAWKLEPGTVSNPLTWFFSGTTPAIIGNAGDTFSYASTTAYVVDATHRNLKISDTSGGSTLTYSLAVVLGT